MVYAIGHCANDKVQMFLIRNQQIQDKKHKK